MKLSENGETFSKQIVTHIVNILSAAFEFTFILGSVMLVVLFFTVIFGGYP